MNINEYTVYPLEEVNELEDRKRNEPHDDAEGCQKLGKRLTWHYLIITPKKFIEFMTNIILDIFGL